MFGLPVLSIFPWHALSDTMNAVMRTLPSCARRAGVVGILLCILLHTGYSQVYVDINATGANDGTSWTDAYTDLNVALTNTTNDDLWIAAGVYKRVNCNPCSASDREQAFLLKNNVALYGGFNGTETDLSQRDFVGNPTILSGDIGVPGDSTDNAYRVVIAENVDATAILDGLIIEEGNADGSFGFSAGGGILLDANPGGIANPIIRNCTIRNNYAGGGGGLAIDCVLGGTCTALIEDCTFTGNTASLGVVSTGAAIFMQGNSGATIAPTIRACLFAGNFVDNDGGAISMTPTGNGTILDPLIDSCTFVGNEATDRGGAIWMRMSSQGTMLGVIKNCVFSNNISGGQGGAIYHRSSFDNVASTHIISCTFENNQATGTSAFNDGDAGAVYLRGSQDGSNMSTVANCLFVGNSAVGDGGAIYNDANIFAPGTCNPQIINNTFVNNSAGGNGNAIFNNEADGTIANCILWNGGDEIADTAPSTSTGTVTNCVIDGGYTNANATVQNIKDANPGFVDEAGGDYRLAPCAPAVDFGVNGLVPADVADLDEDNNTTETLPIDLLQQLRIADGAVDCGAYEYNGDPVFLGVIFVDADASGLNNGSSWTDAYTNIKTALKSNCSGVQVWVAEGTYYPTVTTDREAAFYLENGIELYGGFDGTESDLSERDIAAHPTILSGDIGIPGDSTDNTYRVVIAENVDATAVLDGFIIEEGNADGSFGFSAGGGMLLDANPGGIANPTVRNCTIRNNYAGGGGGVAIDCVLGGVSTALFQNCTFTGNTASMGVVSTGAAMFMQGNSGAMIAPVIKGCLFVNNLVNNDGGAISMTPTGNGTVLDPLIDSCTFIGNVATDRGGAIWMRMSSQGSMLGVIKRCVFTNNTSGGEGGAIYHRSSFDNVASTQIVNCIFTSNTADGTSPFNNGDGGAVFLRGSQDGTNNSVLVNCLFEGNSAVGDGGAVYVSANVFAPGVCAPAIINNTLVNNTAGGAGNGIYNFESTPSIINNILWNGGDEITGSADNPVVTDNIVQGGYSGNGTVADIIDSDPLFVDAGAGDFTLTGCSPAIDVGDNSAIPQDAGDVDEDNNTTEQIDIDLATNPRIVGVNVDLGAYEADGSTPALDITMDSTVISCAGACDGTASVSVIDGTPSYSYLWSNNATSDVISNLCAGTYSVTVMDGGLCTKIDSVQLSDP
ncbi:MAG: hypothetical protein R3301_03600, partial [Saprospiraceae bacterium]|nr:hypothetical protein [Saprospiraceae bacterium]